VTSRGASWIYAGASLDYTAAIFWASSLQRIPVPDGPAGAFSLATNLFHVPLYATLAFLIARTLSAGGREALSIRSTAAVLMLASVSAALDEWHQSFVPGRTAAMSDFLLDVAGVGGMLLLLSLDSRTEVDS